jgi:hemolysin activation/secretion protein
MISSIQWFLRCATFVVALTSSLFAQAPVAAASSTPEPAAAKHPLRQILISESVDAASQFTAPGAGFVALSPALAALDITEFKKRLGDGENRVIEPNLLIAIGQIVEAVARQQNFPNATTVIPSQNIGDGVVRVVLLLNPPQIRRILIGEGTEETLRFSPGPEAGFVSVAPSLSSLKVKDLAKRLALGEGKPFNEKLVAAIVQVIEVFLKNNDYPAATAMLPPQDASDGTLRVAVHFGRIRDIKVEGNRWFSDSLLREKLRIEKGETLRFSELDQAISWTNNNPFRQVRVRIDPVASSTGEADLIIAVQEAFPLRAQFTYDNGGNAIVGHHRWAAAATYGNLWGRDHQVSYQLITTSKGLDLYQGHGFDYRMPLPWRDQVQFSASYLKLEPSLLEGLLTQKGENISGILRYSHPLSTGTNPAEIYAGLEFKQSNNNILFWDTETTSVPVITNKTDIFQLTLGGSMLRRDKRGAWAFGATANFSPGNLNSRNSDAAFESSRPAARSRYFYGQFTFQRLLTLHAGWDYAAKGVVQLSPRNLLSSEQLFVGGASSVRGYRENVFGGDSGALLSNELLSPKLQRKLPWLPKNRSVSETRFVGFYDVAHVRLKQRFDLDPKFAPLASVGIGLRTNVSTNFALSADYGWQITKLPYKTDERSRGHVKATLAF